MILTIITLVRNERYLVPYFLRHYGSLADAIVVYDNQSLDGTAKLLRQHPKVTIVDYDTGGVLRDDIHAKIKSEAYRVLPGDWFIIVDFDEFVWHPGLRAYLESCSTEGWTLPKTQGYSMVGDWVPEDDGRTPLTQMLRSGVADDRYSKRCVVHKDAHIGYTPGCHGYVPRPSPVCWGEETKVKLLHYNWLSLEYGLEKRRRAAAQLSPENLKNGWGKEVLDLAAAQQQYETFRTQATPII